MFNGRRKFSHKLISFFSAPLSLLWSVSEGLWEGKCVTVTPLDTYWPVFSLFVIIETTLSKGRNWDISKQVKCTPELMNSLIFFGCRLVGSKYNNSFSPECHLSTLVWWDTVCSTAWWRSNALCHVEFITGLPACSTSGRMAIDLYCIIPKGSRSGKGFPKIAG